MPDVAFYILQDDQETGREQFACRLTAKAYQQQYSVYIHTDNEAHARRLDDYLWTYDDISFIPHSLLDEPHDPPPPVQIGWQHNPPQRHQVLINLSQAVPSFFQQYERIIEIVPNNEPAKTQARERYKHYQQHHSSLTSHKIS